MDFAGFERIHCWILMAAAEKIGGCRVNGPHFFSVWSSEIA
jgi:hypothetical protein